MSAFEAAVAEVEDVLVIAFRDVKSGSTFMIQRSMGDPDDQEVALHHDTYCLVTDDQVTYYGGVANWSLDENDLTLALTAPAAAVLDLPTTLQFALPPTDALLEVEAALRQVLDGG